MTSRDLESVAETLVAEGKGILAADETVPTLTRRFDPLGSSRPSKAGAPTARCSLLRRAQPSSSAASSCSTRRSARRAQRDAVAEFSQQGILPGIKVDTGAKPLAGSPEETVTEGLDGLRDRLSEYHGMGARFAKWRAVIHVTDTLPSPACMRANAHALARYAALCQSRTRADRRAGSADGRVAHDRALRGGHRAGPSRRVLALFEQGVALEAMLLKPNMVIAGKQSARQASVEEVATATLALLAPARACGGARHRVPVGRAKRPPCDRPPERNQPAPGPEALEDQFLLRAGASGSGAGGVAWAGQEPDAGQQAFFQPGPIERRRQSREVHRRDRGGIARR